MAKINLTPLSVVVNEVFGWKGTPERDTMELQLKEDLQAYNIGQAPAPQINAHYSIKHK